MIMDNCVERNADVGDKLIDCSNCDVILESKQTCAKCGKQQKFNVIIVCFCAMTIAINIILVVTIFSNVNKYKSLQDSIVLLQSQVSSIKRKHDVMVSDFLPDKQERMPLQTDGMFPFINEPTNGEHSRFKRKAKNDRKKRRKRKEYVHVEGTGGQHSPEGIFHKWQLANWTQPTPHKPGIVGTGQKEFLMNLRTGELTIKKKGIYFFYSHITLMGQPDQGYYVERIQSKDTDKIASCMLSFHNSSFRDNDGYDHFLSCSTMGIFQFNSKDRIRLRNSKRGGVIALFDANSSYFGLIKLK